MLLLLNVSLLLSTILDSYAKMGNKDASGPEGKLASVVRIGKKAKKWEMKVELFTILLNKLSSESTKNCYVFFPFSCACVGALNLQSIFSPY